MSQVVIEREWLDGGVSGKQRKGLVGKITLASQGTATNCIPASALNMTVIESFTPVVYVGDTNAYLAVVAADGSKVVLIAPEAKGTPVDVSGLIRFEAAGY